MGVALWGRGLEAWVERLPRPALPVGGASEPRSGHHWRLGGRGWCSRACALRGVTVPGPRAAWACVLLLLASGIVPTPTARAGGGGPGRGAAGSGVRAGGRPMTAPIGRGAQNAAAGTLPLLSTLGHLLESRRHLSPSSLGDVPPGSLH